MTDDQAQKFAQRMIEAWPTGPRKPVWVEIGLKLKDPGAARQAYNELERTAQHISTAQFHIAYGAAKRKVMWNTPPEHCELCDDTGWIDATPAHLDPALPIPTSKVAPCRCTRGEEMTGTHRRILEANNR